MTTHITKTWFNGKNIVTQEIPVEEVYRREWVGLTHKEMYDAIRPLCSADEMATWLLEISEDEYLVIEAKLKEKNTCTPPIAADNEGFYGLPQGSVSTPNAGGKCVTDGETSPMAELWAALTAYQPHADTCGHGKSWRKMCEARTKDAAGAAVSHAVVCASSTNVAADAAHIVWAGGDLGVAIAKIKSITR